MCSPDCDVIHLNGQLRVLYKLFSYLGLIHFNFDPDKQSFQQSRLRFVLSTSVYMFFQYAYGYLTVDCLWRVLFCYLNIITPYEKNTEPISIQENIFRISTLVLRNINTFIFAVNYLRHRTFVLATANEMLDIFKRIQRFTNSSIFIDSSFKKFLVFKACLIVCRMEKDIIPISILMSYGFDIIAPYSHVLCALTIASYFYMQLVLICFYLKMARFLRTHDKTVSGEQLVRRLRTMMSISFRICRVKKKLDKFFVSVFLVTSIGLFTDIQESYEVFKILVYSKYNHQVRSLDWRGAYKHLRRHIPVCLSYSFDLFLICRLSEMLIESEVEFRRCATQIVSREDLFANKNLNRKMEMMLYQNHLFNLSTYAFRQFKMNREFSFDCIINIMTAYVISCLQFYAGQAIYVAAPVNNRYLVLTTRLFTNKSSPS